MPRTTHHLSLDPEIVKAVDDEVRSYGASRSRLVENLLADWLATDPAHRWPPRWGHPQEDRP